MHALNRKMVRFKCTYSFVVVAALCLGIFGSQHEQECPEGSTFLNNKCRKIVCPLGEYHGGICLQVTCPPGLVWRGKKCQVPGYLTTVIEMDSVVINEINEKPMYIRRTGTNKVLNHTTNDMSGLEATADKLTTTSKPPIHQLAPLPADKCCMVRTPRICKMYGQRWICFNRSETICDSRVCKSAVVYLKAPEIKYTHPILIMPPNPENFPNCSNGVCSPQSDSNNVANCSGCESNQPHQCSPYCYKYVCPQANCEFLDLDLYCSYYSGQFGCRKEDGCLWNWC